VFSGTRQTGSEAGNYWVYLETIGGGGGARLEADGLDGIHVHVTNTSNLPIEALELEYPLILERYELIDGSGGTGRHRGGMGLRRIYRATEDCMVAVDISRNLSRSWGLEGGGPGGHGSFSTGPHTDSFVRGKGTLRAGEWLEVITPGGGGYGRAIGSRADLAAQ
jgi:N-methylhydantoinase B